MKKVENSFLSDLDMIFGEALFWDVDIRSIKIKSHARFIIERVLTRGNLQDWKLLKKIFSKQEIQKEALQIRNLDKKTLSFLCLYLGNEKSEFRCCS